MRTETAGAQLWERLDRLQTNCHFDFEPVGIHFFNDHPMRLYREAFAGEKQKRFLVVRSPNC